MMSQPDIPSIPITSAGQVDNSLESTPGVTSTDHQETTARQETPGVFKGLCLFMNGSLKTYALVIIETVRRLFYSYCFVELGLLPGHDDYDDSNKLDVCLI